MNPCDPSSWCPKCKGPMLPDNEGCANACADKGAKWQNEHAANPLGLGGRHDVRHLKRSSDE